MHAIGVWSSGKSTEKYGKVLMRGMNRMSTAWFSSGSQCGMKILVANVEEEIPRVTVQ